VEEHSDADSLRALSDTALVTLCARHPWEQRVESWGCLPALVIGVLVVAACYALWQPPVFDLGVVLGLGFVLLLAAGWAAAGINSLVGLRARPYGAELRHRYEEIDVEEALDVADAAADPPDWTLLACGRGLPHGGHYWARVTLHSASLSGVIETRAWPGDTTVVQAVADDAIARRSAALSEERCRTLLRGLAQEGSGEDLVIPPRVKDGFPCQGALIRHHPLTVRHVSCNLADRLSEPPAHPVMELLALLFDGRSLENTLQTEMLCPRCGALAAVEIELYVGARTLLTYHLGDTVQWRSDYHEHRGGRPEQGDSDGRGYAECLRCHGHFFVHVQVRADVIVGVVSDPEQPS